MTKQGVVYVPATLCCPDRWSYSFDGKTLMIREEFDDMPEEGWEATIKILKQFGFETKRDGNVASLTMEVPQDKAVEYCLSEFITQATILGLISNKTRFKIGEEML